MKTQEVKEFKLIDNTFTPDEANALLISLINSKINYHNLDDFSNFVRMDRNIEHSKKRVLELNETKNTIRSFIDLANEKGCNLMVKSTISIAFTNNV